MPDKPKAPFAQLPAGAIADDRLRGADLRVLAALCRADPGRSGKPFRAHRQPIAVKTALPETAVSRAISRLIELGWLVRTAHAGRGKASEFTIQWWHDGHEKGNTRVTLSGLENVTPVSPFTDRKGNNGVTLLPPEKGNNCVTLFNEKCDTGVTPYKEDRDISTSGVSTETPSRDLVPNRHSPSRSHAGAGTRAQESDRTGQDDLVKYGAAVELLMNAGMPYYFLENQDDRQKIRAWCHRFTHSQVSEACGIAAKHASTVGPRYVDTVLHEELKHAANGNGRKSSGSGAGHAKGEEAGAAFLRGD